MSIRHFALATVMIFFTAVSFAQKVYKIDATGNGAELRRGQLKFGNPGPNDRKIEINNQYMTLGGKPIIPVMGEMHYSRVARKDWEDRILKMKACGINIVACYVLWVHHEEIEGQFDWSDNKDLRAFVELCAKHGLWVYPRIGPWCHAEVRNGGTPDWLLLKNNMKNRSNDPVYQHYAEEWYKQIGAQLKGLMYKDGGPVVGVQLENEYGYGKSGEAHILWLKHTAIKYGIDVPLYTVTGWGNGSVPPYEVVPLWGAYPDEPWASHLARITDCRNYQFSPYRNDEGIGNEVSKSKEPYIDYAAYPFFTCEMGVGIENTDHRRLQIAPLDGYGLVMAKLGSGSNLPGYYMFVGGSNPHGILTTLEENREETGYWNTNPIISYDFQAAIRESGELNGSYFEIKKLHYFLNEFGDRLAPMQPVLNQTTNDLQCALRVKDSSAFLFGINYCRHNISSAKKGVQFSIKLKNETVQFPSKPITVKDSSFFIWPVNFQWENVLIKYATAQPLCMIDDKLIFIQDADQEPEFCFAANNIQSVKTSGGKVEKVNNTFMVKGIKPDLQTAVTIVDINNTSRTILILSAKDARNAWLFKENNKKYFFVSDNGLYINDSNLHVFGTSNKMNLQLLHSSGVNAMFKRYAFEVAAQKVDVETKEIFALDGALKLRTGVDSIDKHSELVRRFFVKEFSLNNPAAIKKATLSISAATSCKVQLNNLWVNQAIVSDTLNTLDLTGYVKKGENRIMVDFPFEKGRKSFAATLQVEYNNADRVAITTDTTWLTRDSYTYPSYLTKDEKYKMPEVVAANEHSSVINGNRSYAIALTTNSTGTLKAIYCNIRYNGDKAKMYNDSRLAADDFNSGAAWITNLLPLIGQQKEKAFVLEISPLSQNAKVYFDEYSVRKAALEAGLINVSLTPEYETIVSLKVFGERE